MIGADGPALDPACGPELTRQIGELFGARSDGVTLAERYAMILATIGVEHGVIGPKEKVRIWDRHLLNCAAIAEFLPQGAAIVDVGSGAGLPGVALACARADLEITLLEPLERRVRFLSRVLDELGLAQQVRLVRGRAGSRDTVAEIGRLPFATARAVAPLDRLASWCLPLVAPRGELLAMKGRSAETEIATHRTAVHQAGGEDVRVRWCGASALKDPVAVVSIRKVAGVS